MRPFLLLALLPFLLCACGKSDNSSVTGAPVTVTQPDGSTVTTTSNTYSLTTGPVGQYPYVYANYQFKENGCDTGLHKFSGPAAEIAMAQLCNYLQNEWGNHNCARDLRMAYFYQVCH